ncbi:DUF1800 domain-containing protein [Afipia felis]|uniref:Protein of uncharacterized function (DUF1800) n=2 Tax=Afipia felis TaxID=1035 RepID=A0A380WDH1_AFIFE|nr:DUF1800 family protein [Afipia felis]EKS29425.1 hypothetical protein HMPREF9697_01953 [Afipia felis ATCC 53690]SUU78132.1 Protein of uncharacterised function (DUF1800) [Afipia felis]SUU86197.1 Protein of uncharacterised function (DUF1800) [Afipia felis]
MARDPHAALIALNRFGLGARGGGAGDFANAASDPRGFVKAELGRSTAALLNVPGLQTTQALAQVAFDYQEDVKQQRKLAAQALTMASDKPADPARPGPKAGTIMRPLANDAAVKPSAPQPPNVIQKAYRAEALARVQRATMAESGIVERLVAFWSNHFCISANKGQLDRIWAGSFEREVIRPHVLGRFSDMLLAVEQHPAMLFYLDNQQSIGPNSRAGRNRKRGLNENLARELMELHTLGVGNGYTQQDVTTLAAILTGWTFAGRAGRLGEPGTFIFNANAHEPGPQKLLGKVYDDTGVAQGEAALADIARRPATAKFIAHKLAAHFVADDPPPALVAKLEASFRNTDGDLKALATTLVDSDEAWAAPMTKIRTPNEFLVATGRIMGRIPDDPGRYLGALNLLGQPLWTPPGPNGFSDATATWASPENVKLRLDVASQISARIADMLNPVDVLEACAGEAASDDTRKTVARAETRQQALALLLMSPEFQRR